MMDPQFDARYFCVKKMDPDYAKHVYCINVQGRAWRRVSSLSQTADFFSLEYFRYVRQMCCVCTGILY